MDNIKKFISLNNNKYESIKHLIIEYKKNLKYIIYLKPLNLSIKEYILSKNNPSEYTLEDFQNIFEKYNETNNGIILSDNIFSRSIKRSSIKSSSIKSSSIINNSIQRSITVGGTDDIYSSMFDIGKIQHYCGLITNNNPDENTIQEYIDL